MLHSRIISDKIHTEQSIFASEMYSTIRVEWAAYHFGLGSTQIDPILTKMSAKNNFYIIVPSDLDL